MTTSIQQNSSLYKELKLIREDLKQGRISYGDLAFLENHQAEIKEYFPDDMVLWAWAGIPEEEWNERG